MGRGRKKDDEVQDELLLDTEAPKDNVTFDVAQVREDGLYVLVADNGGFFHAKAREGVEVPEGTVEVRVTFEDVDDIGTPQNAEITSAV